MKRSLAVCLILLFLPGSPVEAEPPPSPRTDTDADPARVGQWAGPYSWPLVAIHSLVLHTGKVLQYSFTGSPTVNTNAFVWDPSSNLFVSKGLSRTLFCSGQAFLPDGRVIVAGGTVPGTPPGVFQGLADTHLFDPLTESWTRVADMAQGRWYPTVTALPDGRVAAFSGLDENGVTTPNIEIFHPDSGWRSAGSVIGLPLYPWMHLTSNGHLYYSGPSRTTAYITVDPVGVYGLRNSNYGNRNSGVPVCLPPGPDRILILGGTRDSLPTATAEILDLTAASPAWRYTASMSHARKDANAVILPDGKVLVIGGHRTFPALEHPDGLPVLEPELFDPATESWSSMASHQLPRIYHSTATLLPDGRVVTGGGDGVRFAEIYSPPYLFRGPRPVIESAPLTMTYGSACCVKFTSTTTHNQVVLIRPTAVTHGVNMESRYLLLKQTSCGPGTKEVRAPESPNLAPPGYYMMFVVNEDGLPSEARFVRLVLDCTGGCDCDPSTSCPGSFDKLVTGDLNNDGQVTSSDIVYAVAYVFRSGPAPAPCAAVADVDCSGVVTSTDIIYQVNYVFKSGPPPCDVCPLIPARWTCN